LFLAVIREIFHKGRRRRHLSDVFATSSLTDTLPCDGSFVTFAPFRISEQMSDDVGKLLSRQGCSLRIDSGWMWRVFFLTTNFEGLSRLEKRVTTLHSNRLGGGAIAVPLRQSKEAVAIWHAQGGNGLVFIVFGNFRRMRE
jgi:hypothetical protein